MNNRVASQPRPVFFVLLTLTGIFIGLLLTLLAVWADYESTSYGFMKRANAPLRGLSCPVFLGKNESGAVSVKVTNSTDGPLSPSVRTEVSTPQFPDSKLEFLQLAPGESATVQRTVGPENVDLGYFIFVSAATFSMYPSPDREATCGIFIVPFEAGSSWLLGLGSGISLLLMVTGSFFLYRHETSTNRSRALLFMVAATALALLFVLLGWWVQPLLLIIMVVLTFLTTLGRLF